MHDLERFWHHVWSVGWIADTGLPLLLAGVGLWVAVKLVGRQIENDRDLRRADHRRDRVAAVAVQFEAASDQLRGEPEDSQYWQAASWPSASPVLDAIRRSASAQSRASRDQQAGLAGEIATAWRWVFEHRDAKDANHGPAMRVVMAPFAVVLDRAADSLNAWDGLDQQPMLSPEVFAAARVDRSDLLNEYRAQIPTV